MIIGRRLIKEGIISHCLFGFMATVMVSIIRVFMFIIPFNYIIRGALDVKYYWDNLRSKPTKRDIQVYERIRQETIEIGDYFKREYDRKLSGR